MNAQSQGASAPTVFQFQESIQLRVITIDGNPWFVAADVCAALDIKRTSDAVEKLDDDEKGTGSIRTLGGQQEMLIVNESGMNAIILRCRDAMTSGTPAHKYRKWVTSEVLPSIRKTGNYSVIPNSSPQADELLTPKDQHNVTHFIWLIARRFHYEGAWVQGCWKSLRKASNTPSPRRFKVNDLPLVVDELRRIAMVAETAAQFVREAEAAFLKRAIVNRESVDHLLAEQRRKLETQLAQDNVALRALLTDWEQRELRQITARTDSGGRNSPSDALEIL